MLPNPKKYRQYPFKRQLKRKTRRIIFILVAAALASGINYYQKYRSSTVNIFEHPENYSASQSYSNSEQQQAIQKTQAKQKILIPNSG